MDQKRLLVAIAISIGILLTFEVINRPQREALQQQQRQAQQQVAGAPATPAAPTAVTATPTPADGSAPGQGAATPAAQRPPAARLAVETPAVEGTLNLRGARLDDLVLRNYTETVNPNSPRVRLLSPRDTAQPYFAQWGWTARDGRTRVPDNETDWQPSAPRLTPTTPVTLSWDNGQGQVFEIALSIDDRYLVTAEQRVRNTGAEPALVQPWSRIRREATPHVEGFFILHEGFVGVLDGRLRETTYSDAKSEGQKRNGVALEQETGAGWAGFTDKYWLTAIAAVDRNVRLVGAYRHTPEGTQDRWQVDFTTPQPQTVAPQGTAGIATRLFAGAKEVATLDAYQERLGIPDFDKAVDFGWFYFLTKPFFYALDWLFHLLGNFGVAILVFTLAIKAAFFPLANKAYHSMAKMKILGPKMQEIRERHKEDPAKAQQEMMALYRSEKINPASGCLPILIQIPVFFALYKVLFVTIEMRHAPFFGWIRDLSAPDPTNLFNLFGLLPFDPAAWSHYLHMPVWALIMGVTMFVQQKLNPQPPDPIQAKIFTWMPVIFTFMLASFPAGLVIYWSWNNLLSIAQQYYIMSKDAEQAARQKAQRQAMAGAVRGMAARLRGPQKKKG